MKYIVCLLVALALVFGFGQTTFAEIAFDVRIQELRQSQEILQRRFKNLEEQRDKVQEQFVLHQGAINELRTQKTKEAEKLAEEAKVQAEMKKAEEERLKIEKALDKIKAAEKSALLETMKEVKEIASEADETIDEIIEGLEEEQETAVE